jgi:hypothetical protein
MDPASEIRPTLDDVVNEFGLIRFAVQFLPTTTAGTLQDSIRSQVMLELIWSSQPTCESCNSLTIFIDKHLFFQPISTFVLTVDQGCKFCALLPGIVLCVPESKRDAMFDLSFRRASFKISYSQLENKRKFFLDYFINKGRLSHQLGRLFKG